MLINSDIQILKLPKMLKSIGLIDNIGQFYEETGISKARFSNIKNHEKHNRPYHFTPQQIERVCLIYGIDFNWVFGVSEEVFNRKIKIEKHLARTIENSKK